MDINKLLNLPKGSPGLKEAIRLIKERGINDFIERESGGRPLGRMVPTKYGGVEDSKSLAEMVKRAEMEDAYRMADERIKATTPQRWQPSLAPTPQGGFQDYGVGFGEEAPGMGYQEPQLYDGPNVQPSAVKGASSMNPGEFGQFASDWYTSVGHQGQADKAALIAQKAAEYGLDPYMALALSAQEGGWSRYHPEESPNNYFGWGVTDSGDMGLGSQDLGGWLDEYMPDIVKQYGGRDSVTDWGGSLEGLGEGSPYTARYNYNDSWVKAISSLMNQANQFRESNYPNLPGPSINTAY